MRRVSKEFGENADTGRCKLRIMAEGHHSGSDGTVCPMYRGCILPAVGPGSSLTCDPLLHVVTF